jgi:parallel beta-helix repeat protein
MATLYVNQSIGNDANNGTVAHPLKTIQKASNLVIPNDGVIVSAGIYPERVTVSRSGISGNEISFTADGTVECRGFTVNADYILVNGLKVTATEASYSAPAYGIYVTGKYCTIENNYAYYSPRGGIYLTPSSSYCIVRNNRCHRNGTDGMVVDGSSHLIDNNEVWGSIFYHTPTGLNAGDADGIRFFGSGHIFRGNYIHDIKYDDPENVGYDPHIDGFQTWTDSNHAAASNILIEKNLIVLPVYKTAAANGHGFMLHNCSYIIIRNNIVFTHGGINTNGYQTGGPTHHVKIENNTFIGRLDFTGANFPVGISLQNCVNSCIKNNIVYNQLLNAIYIDSASLTGLEISNNCIYNENGSTPGGTHYPNDLWGANPLFVDPINLNYRLRAGSPCIDAGITLSDMTDDFESRPRPIGAGYDIGAYEYQEESMAIKTVPFTLAVTAAPDFFPAILPTSLSVAKGVVAVYTVSFTAQGGFTGPVSLAALNLPTGAVATFSKISINVTETSTLSITTTAVALGTFSLTLEGTAAI